MANTSKNKNSSSKESRRCKGCGQLEKSLEAYKTELHIAKTQLEAVKVVRNNFLSHMSHELRTPLNAILGFSRLMVDDSNLSEKQVENLRLIHQSGELLLSLINNILDIAKLDAGLASLDAKHMDFHQFVKGMATMFTSRAAGHGLAFTLDMEPEIPGFVTCDERKLQQILINLMDNSIKYTDTGNITLRIWSSPPPQDERGSSTSRNNKTVKLYFELRDTGEGIPMEIRDKIFDPFFAGAENDDKQTGLGLGLTICRNFAMIMGGDISVTDCSEKGAAVTFNITVDRAPEQEEKDRYRVTGISTTKTRQRILVVDDDRSTRFLLSELLDEVGFKVKEAENGEQAVALFFEWRPHLVFMDIRMPLMDGMVATKIIKATREGSKIPVIALTAHARDEKRRNILAAGCDDFIRKPFDDNQVFETIARHLDMAYIMESSPQAASQDGHKDTEDTVEALAELSTAFLEHLKQSALELDLDQINDCMDHIQSANTTVGASLKKLVKRFRFNELYRLADQALQTRIRS